MRIGIDTTPLTGGRTGVGHFLYYQVKHMLRLEPALAWRYFASGRRAPVLDGLSGFDRGRYVPLPTRVMYGVWTALRNPPVDTLLGGLDVFHAANYFLPPVRNARRVLTIYDLAFLRVPEWCSPKIVGPFSRQVPRFVRRADAILTCSEASKRDIVALLQVPPERITVAHGAVDELFQPTGREAARVRVAREHGIHERFVLFVSTLEPRKNVVGLLQAFAKLARVVPHQLVLIGGEGWGVPPVAELAAKLGIADRVVRMGYLPSHADLAAFYSAADCFVLPSWYEGFGLPVLEAMTCGCPVVTSPVSSMPEVAGDAAQYADPADPDAIAGVVLGVLGDADLRARMAQAGRARAARFTWEACARTTLDVYRSLA